MSEYRIKHKYPAGFFEALKEHLNEKILDDIAHADSGLGAAENRKIIDNILETNTVPYPLLFNPNEAIQLTMWWSPNWDTAQGISSVQLRTEHIARAFCCACLLTNTPSEYCIEPVDILPRLFQSVIEIDTALLPHTREMVLCARLNHADKTDEDMILDEMLCRLAIILIDAYSDSTDFPNGDLAQRCQQIITDEQNYRDTEEVKHLIHKYPFDNYKNWNQWLLGMSFFVQSVDVWIELTNKILLEPRVSLSDADRVGCRELAKNILGITN